MALDAGNVKIYCRGVDLSTALQSTTVEQSRDEQDTTAYADTLRTMQPTLQRLAIAHAGVYTDGTFTLGETFRSASTTDDEPITVFPEGATAGNKAFMALAHKASIRLPEDVVPGAIHRASLRASSRMPLADGSVGFSGTISSASQTASYQLGAPTALQTIVATVHLTAISLSPNVTFILESDDATGFPSATTRATSAAQTTRGSVVLTATGLITDDWWRVRWTYSGSGNFTAVVGLGIAK